MPDSAEQNHSSPLFLTTRWSVVVAAQDDASPAAASALATLCTAYWYPLYAYVRRQGQSPHDAQDLTQEFFARMIEKDYLLAAAREKGRFRTFLLVALKRFLANEWDRSRARKRSGGCIHVPLDAPTAELRYAGEPAAAPDEIFERRWALTLLETTLARLREAFVAAGKLREFECLKGSLTAARGAIPYEELAEALETSEGAARVAVHRLRKPLSDPF